MNRKIYWREPAIMGIVLFWLIGSIGYIECNYTDPFNVVMTYVVSNFIKCLIFIQVFILVNNSIVYPLRAALARRRKRRAQERRRQRELMLRRNSQV